MGWFSKTKVSRGLFNIIAPKGLPNPTNNTINRSDFPPYFLEDS